MKKKIAPGTSKTQGRQHRKRIVKQPIGKVSAGNVQLSDVIPGQIFLADGEIVALQGRATIDLTVSNLGDRPVQVGSHCHFFEVNRALRFDREKAFGFRLRVPAGTAVRFEPGEERQVTLVAIGGNRIASGINGLTNGRLDDPDVRKGAMDRARERGFIQKGVGQ